MTTPHHNAPPSPAKAEAPSVEELSDADAQRLYDEAAPKPFSAHEVERFVRTTVDPQAEVLALQKQRNVVYEERNRLVCALSKVFPSWLGRHDNRDMSWDEDWRWIVFVELPTGQASWHVHDSEVGWFAHCATKGDAWDGHTTEEKYERLSRLHSNPAPAPSRAQGVDVERVFSNLIRMGYAYEAANDMRNAVRAALTSPGISTAEGGGDNG